MTPLKAFNAIDEMFLLLDGSLILFFCILKIVHDKSNDDPMNISADFYRN